MLIVVEGCDGSGKTTLVKDIEQRMRASSTRCEVVHMGPPSEGQDPFHQYTNAIMDYSPLEHLDDMVIFDRLHLGEHVYGPLYRGRSQLSNTQMRIIESLLDARGAVKLMLTAPTEILEQRAFEQRGEDFVQRAHIETIRRAYVDLAAIFPAWTVWNTAVGIPPEDVRYLLNFAAERAEAAYAYWEKLSA